MSAISLGVGSLLACMTFGKLPPDLVQEDLYRQCLRQARVPEVLRIKVVSVHREVTWCPSGRTASARTWRRQDLTVYAVVLEVKRSATGLKPGSLVQFSYAVSNLCPRMVGPSNRPHPRLVSRGQVIWALLERARRKAPEKPTSLWPLSQSVRRALGRPFEPFWLAAGAKSLVTRPPSFPSLDQWDAHCDKLYPYRRSRLWKRAPAAR